MVRPECVCHKLNLCTALMALCGHDYMCPQFPENRGGTWNEKLGRYESRQEREAREREERQE